VIGGDFVEEFAEVLEGESEEFFFGFVQVALGFVGKHFQGIEDASGGAKVYAGFARCRVGDFSQEKAPVLGLEIDERREPRVRCFLFNIAHVPEARRIPGEAQEE